MYGFINLLKPPGMTSSSAVVAIRKLLPRGAKVGHCGTLDPEAAGVLPIMLGKATRLSDYVMSDDKEYVCELALGVATDTQDATGSATFTGQPVDAEAVKGALAAFTGDIMQRPSAYSALKRDGRKLYELARKGEHVEIEPRPVRIDAIEYISPLDGDGYLLRVACGKGTYIRALCDDIGRALGCGGHMRFLLRTRTGQFDIAAAHTLEEVTASLADCVLPMDAPLKRLPVVIAPAIYAPAIRCGNKLSAARMSGDVPEGDVPARLYVGEERPETFAGIVRRDGDMLRFNAMLMGDENL